MPVGPGNDVTAIVKFYASDPDDTVLPTTTPIATYTLTGLPRDDLAYFTHTFDVPTPVLVPEDLWVGVEFVDPLPSLLATLAHRGDPDLPVSPVLGTSHDWFWFGPGPCLWAGSLVEYPYVTFYLTVRVFTEGANQAPSCTVDLEDARARFLEPAPAAFVVSEGETFSVVFTGQDPDGDPLTATASGLPPGATLTPGSGPSPLDATLEWTPIAADKAGAPYTVTVTFTDPSGAGSSCQVAIADVNLDPLCMASDREVECTSAAGAAVTLDGSATDADDASLMFHWDVSNAAVVLDDADSAAPSGTFPLGVTMATLTVTDGRGGIAVCDVLVTVQDTTPPAVLCTTDVAALWPPNHTMRPVALIVAATDACQEPDELVPISVRVRSDEPDDAPGLSDGNTTGDVDGLDGYSLTPGSGIDVSGLFHYDAGTSEWRGTVHLRAERDDNGDGRKYTIDVLALDHSGNPATTSCCVVVPHDRRGIH